MWMKRVSYVLMAVATLAVFANCGKKDDGPNATATMNAGCYNWQTTTSVPQQRTSCAFNYSAYSSQGFSNYGSGSTSYTSNTWNSWGNTANYNGCSSYQAMVYSAAGKGLGCVDSGRITYSGIPARYQLNPATNEFMLLPPQALGSGYGYGNTSYPVQYDNSTTTGSIVYRVCDDTDPCPSGLSCRSPLGNIPTSLGLCYH